MMKHAFIPLLGHMICMGNVGDGIMEERERLSECTEPLLTEYRDVRADGRDAELLLNIPNEAVRMLDVDEDSRAQIEIYQDGYVVRFGDS